MILPSKHISQDRALLSVGAQILDRLRRPQTVSALWEGMQGMPSAIGLMPRTQYDAYVLALDLLFLMGALQLENGLLSRKMS